MSAPSPTWSDVISSVTAAFQNLLKGLADAISQNASTIAQVVVGLGIAVTVGYAIYRYAIPMFTRVLRTRLF
jgi:high-affinity Fe2+/Pb2+ permease